MVLPSGFEIGVILLVLFLIIILMNMFKLSDKLARMIVKKDVNHE